MLIYQLGLNCRLEVTYWLQLTVYGLSIGTAGGSHLTPIGHRSRTAWNFDAARMQFKVRAPHQSVIDNLSTNTTTHLGQRECSIQM